MITVDDALARLFALVSPLPTEMVPLRQAAGRVLRGTVTARVGQPPFPAAAMDGYAIATTKTAPGDSFDVIGESAAGHGFRGSVAKGEAVRIFTGAPMPNGGRRIIIQEDVSRRDNTITLKARLDEGLHIRAAEQDFGQGDAQEFPAPLRPVDLALIAAMGQSAVAVTRKPRIAIIATGDELVAPGDLPGRDQIIASNNLGLATMVERSGGTAHLLPIARDTEASLSATFDLAVGADLVITIGGASVGDHDLVAKVAAARGMERSFYKVAMRPGKPLMAGKLDGAPMIGLPGNPVSSMVCGEIFIKPVLDVLLGFPAAKRTTQTARLTAPLVDNGPRAHYMRATLSTDGIRVAERQDSALLGVLAASNALVVRPPHDPARATGEPVDYLPI